MKQRIKRAARIILGWVFLVLGVFGLFLPLLQGIIFLAVGAFLLAPYIRVFRKMQRWLHRRFPHAEHFTEKLHKRFGHHGENG